MLLTHLLTYLFAYLLTHLLYYIILYDFILCYTFYNILYLLTYLIACLLTQYTKCEMYARMPICHIPKCSYKNTHTSKHSINGGGGLKGSDPTHN